MTDLVKSIEIKNNNKYTPLLHNILMLVALLNLSKVKIITRWYLDMTCGRMGCFTDCG